MNERRDTPRARTILGGAISFDNGRSTLECRVRNYSARGARIEFAGTAVLPDAFDLTISRKETLYRARMVWRSKDAAGVVFVNADEGRAIPLEYARRLKTLEAQNKALRQRISEQSEGVT